MDQNRQFTMTSLIDLLDSLIGNPSEGLPEDIFLFVSRMTPIINVDLLIKNEIHQTLLTWRDGGHYLPGWHIPGGVIRYKETISERIKAVAAGELGAEVNFRQDPLAINEVILPSRKVRGHSISLLYECTLINPPEKNLKHQGGLPRPGQWAWHDKCPPDLIPVHEMYRKYL